MEKICIVNLRKKTVGPVTRNEECGEAHYERGYGSPAPLAPPHAAGFWFDDPNRRCIERSEKKEFTAGNVSLSLSQEQISALRTDPYLISFLRREFSDAAGETAYRGDPIVIKLAWEAPASGRLLRPEDVLQMLRIGKGSLMEIVRKGQLKSYKIGRLRRFLLDDILSYLEENQDSHDYEQQDAAPCQRESC